MKFKILLVGIHGSGRSTILRTLYKITKEWQLDIDSLESPQEELSFIWKFHENITYTVSETGKTSIKKQFYEDADGMLLVIDAQPQIFEDNVDYIKYLKVMTSGLLIKKIPLVVMLNKHDISKEVTINDITQLLLNERLWYEPPHELSMWNPVIYEACALYEKHYNIYHAFSECARRVFLYHFYGNGKAPLRRNDNENLKLN